MEVVVASSAGWHTPPAPHTWHPCAPQVEREQQTPSVQKPELHSADVEQVRPSWRPHLPAASQVLSPVQNGVCVPFGTDEQLPAVAPGAAHELHAEPQERDAQQTPSVQKSPV